MHFLDALEMHLRHTVKMGLSVAQLSYMEAGLPQCTCDNIWCRQRHRAGQGIANMSALPQMGASTPTQTNGL
eukprot:scaffold122585_cov19-Tisochrysis_lutea.AAC.2